MFTEIKKKPRLTRQDAIDQRSSLSCFCGMVFTGFVTGFTSSACTATSLHYTGVVDGNVTGRAAAVGSDRLFLVAISLIRPLPLMPYTFMPSHLLWHKKYLPQPLSAFTVADTFLAMTLLRPFLKVRGC